MINKNIYQLKKYCTEYQKIENYDTALKSPLRYDLHHRREISEMQSRSDLIFLHLYYHRPPEELIFLSHGEHIRLHNAGKYVSDETKQKMSAAKKGEKCYMYGKPKSAETRKRMSDANKGEKNPMFGKHPSAETRQKMSNAKKGKHFSEEHKQKLSIALKGHHRHIENGHYVYTD